MSELLHTFGERGRVEGGGGGGGGGRGRGAGEGHQPDVVSGELSPDSLSPSSLPSSRPSLLLCLCREDGWGSMCRVGGGRLGQDVEWRGSSCSFCVFRPQRILPRDSRSVCSSCSVRLLILSSFRLFFFLLADWVFSLFAAGGE